MTTNIDSNSEAKGRTTGMKEETGMEAVMPGLATAIGGKGMHISPAMANAWTRYLEGLEEIRQMIYSSKFAATQSGQAEAHYLVYQAQACAFQMAIAPRPDYPAFFPYFDPLFYTWAGMVPDFCYRNVVRLDGSRKYRIWGKRGTTKMLLMQVQNGFWNDPQDQVKLLGNFDLDKLQTSPDGSFEIVASAQPQDGNWFELDPDSRNNCILVREAYYDWENEQAAELHIEVIDNKPSPPWVFDEKEFIERIDGAVRYMKYPIEFFTMSITQNIIDRVGYHSFYTPSFEGGASPAATYNMLAYDLGPDDALIIESEIPNPKYWGVLVTDNWTQTTDYVFHQSSTNGHQAVIDSDGKFRAVLSKQDPGVPNWLDPVDSLQGQIQVRWYYAERSALPTARKVPVNKVRDYLPLETPSVTLEERAALLGIRRRAAQRRYHR